MIAYYKSYSELIRLDSQMASGSVVIGTPRHHRMFVSMLKSQTSLTSLFCECHCSVVFVFRHLQILYFLREMVLN
jgi:hypothetical protein